VTGNAPHEPAKSGFTQPKLFFSTVQVALPTVSAFAHPAQPVCAKRAAPHDGDGATDPKINVSRTHPPPAES